MLLLVISVSLPGLAGLALWAQMKLPEGSWFRWVCSVLALTFYNACWGILIWAVHYGLTVWDKVPSGIHGAVPIVVSVLLGAIGLALPPAFVKAVNSATPVTAPQDNAALWTAIQELKTMVENSMITKTAIRTIHHVPFNATMRPTGSLTARVIRRDEDGNVIEDRTVGPF